MKKHTNAITLPRYLAEIQRRKYITQSGPMMQPLDVALRLAIVLRNHGTVESVRRLARTLADQVCAEQRPRLKELGRRPTNDWEHQRDPAVRLNGVPDDRVIECALNIINRYCALAGIAPDTPFAMEDRA